MFCRKCGNKIEDGAQFCPHCGNPAAASEPGYSAPEAPTPYGEASTGPEIARDDGRRRGFVVLAAVGGAAVIAIIAAVVLLSGLFSGAKGDLTKAVAKSLGDIHASSQAAGLPDWKELTKEQKATQTLSLGVKSISDDLSYYTPELSLLEGLGFSMTEGVNLPDHKLDASFAVTYGDTDVLSAWMDVDDAVLTLGSPDLLGDTVFGLNTETLGRDLAAIGDVPEDTASISFNIFDTMESLSRTVEVDKSAFKDLTDAIEVEKAGKSSVDVNGYTLDCAAYRVTIPEAALHTYLGAVEDAYAARGLDSAFLDLFASLGVSAEELEEMREDMQDALSGKALFDALNGAVDEAGDLKLDVFVNGGYISAAEWSGEIDGEEMTLRLCLGGGENYADDWSFELRRDSDRLTISSTGDHSAGSGVYTDETSIAISAVRSGDRIKITSTTSWEPKAKGSNFQWSLKTSGVALTASGQLTAGKDSLSLTLDQLAVNALGTDLATFSGGYSIQPYAPSSHSAKTPSMLADLTQDDLLEIYQDVILNSQEWVLDLGNRIPGLYQYLW